MVFHCKAYRLDLLNKQDSVRAVGVSLGLPAGRQRDENRV